ncbi:tetratricopeptide repeat-containing diguanylate cyclase [Echinimonas agarilytica]|uniref:diguanylate cyclase n=1 Tax=Echinimonas agarilytica TaxID=1215918 RepID=A0AA41WA03_9GAMM|nr:tetratricopeptide repeat-containing diguanylate cyclase [Echinimonas agarilytica]MCM2681048.1 diguanylate cyclase [Echinimonas agarilytica]
MSALTPSVSLGHQKLEQAWKHCQQGNAVGCFVVADAAENGRQFVDYFMSHQGVTGFRWKLNERDSNLPFSTLVPVLTQILQQRKLAIDDVLHTLNVQGQYRDILSAAFSGKPMRRRELPLPDDLLYEQNHVVDLFIDIIQWLATKQPLCISLGDLHHAGPSALVLIRRLLDSDDPFFPLMLICTLEPDYMHSEERMQDSWHQFIDWMDNTQGRIQVQPSDNLAASHKWSETPSVVNSDPRAMIRECEDLLSLMNLPECAYVSERVERSFVQKGLGHDSNSRLHLKALRGHCLLYLGEMDDAFEALEGILEQAQLGSDKRALARAYRHLCWAYIYKSDLTQAMNCGRQAINYSSELSDEKERAQCLFYYFVACAKANVGFGVERFAEMLHLLQDQQCENAVIYACRNVYGQLEHSETLTPKQVLAACMEAIRLARQTNQHAGLAASFHSRAVILHRMGKPHQAKRCYKVAERLLKCMNDPLDMARLRNGFGFFYCHQEQFLSAYDYFNGALKQVMKVGHVNETVATLYNLAWLYLVVRHYRHSASVLEQLRRLMVGQHANYFAYRNLHDVHLLQGLVHAFNQEWLRAVQCLERSKRLSIPLSKSARVIRPMLEYLLTATEHLADAEDDYVALVEQRLLTSGRLHSQFKLLWLETRVRYHLLLGNSDAARDMVIDATSEQEQQPLGWNAIRQLLLGKHKPLVNLPLPSMALDHLFVLAQQEARLNQLWKRMREVRLISALQAIGSDATSEVKIARETVRLLCGHYDFQLAMVVNCQSEKTEVMAVHVDGQVKAFPIEELADDVKDFRNQQLLLNRSWLLSSGSRRLSAVCVLPLRDGNLRCCQLVLVNLDLPYVPGKHDQEVLTLISNQMASQMAAVRQQNKLIELSSVDTLTGLSNRQSLQTTMQDEINRVRRYAGATGFMSLAFIDLDNFKYYNDTFGHDAGDLLLQWFSDLLLEQLRDVDVAGRWGGDEFIVFLPETSGMKAEMVGERILQALVTKRGFAEQLSHALKRAVNIPEHKWLSCSVGVSETNYQKTVPEAATMLSEADKALYQAKETGKGKVIRFR